MVNRPENGASGSVPPLVYCFAGRVGRKARFGGRCVRLFRVTLSLPMTKLDAHERLRRAASLLAHEGAKAGDRTLLLQAWEVLRGLRSDDFPVEMRPAFNFLQHEIARAESEDVSARDVVFLSNKLRQLELMWIENSGKSAQVGSPDNSA